MRLTKRDWIGTDKFETESLLTKTATTICTTLFGLY